MTGCWPALWLLLAPTAVGGSTRWVVTDGVSMEPRFHSGDLALVREQSDYRVGQIVAYRNRQLDTIVLHRIVARDGSRYVFKGDNNNFVDFEHPRRSQLLGRDVDTCAGGRRATSPSIRSPALIGGLFALATLLFGAPPSGAAGDAGAASGASARRRPRHGGPPCPPRPSCSRSGSWP